MERRRVVLWWALCLLLLIGTDHGVKAATHVERSVRDRNFSAMSALLNAAIFRLSGEKPGATDGLPPKSRLDLFGKPLPSLPDLHGNGPGLIGGKNRVMDDRDHGLLKDHMETFHNLIQNDQFQLFDENDQSLDTEEADILLENMADAFSLAANEQGMSEELGSQWFGPWGKKDEKKESQPTPSTFQPSSPQQVAAIPRDGDHDPRIADENVHAEEAAAVDKGGAPDISKLSQFASKFQSMIRSWKTRKGPEALSTRDVLWAILFGFINGFFSGMGDMLRDAINHPSCAELLDDVNMAFYSAGSAWLEFFTGLFSAKTRQGRSRTDMFKLAASKTFAFLKALMKLVWNCRPLYVVLGTMIVVVTIALIITMALAATVYGILVKIAEIVMTIYFGIDFFWKTLKKFVRNAKCIFRGQCLRAEKRAVIESVAELLGLIAGAIMMSDLDKIVKVENIKSFFKTGNMKGVKVKWDATMEKEMRALVQHMSAKKQKWSHMGSSIKTRILKIRGGIRNAYKSAKKSLSKVGDNISGWWNRITKRGSSAPKRPSINSADNMSRPTAPTKKVDVSSLTKKEAARINTITSSADEATAAAMQAEDLAKSKLLQAEDLLKRIESRKPRPSDDIIARAQRNVDNAKNKYHETITNNHSAHQAKNEVTELLDEFVREFPKDVTGKVKTQIISDAAENAGHIRNYAEQSSRATWNVHNTNQQIDDLMKAFRTADPKKRHNIISEIRALASKQDDFMKAMVSGQKSLDDVLKTAMTTSDDPYTVAFWKMFQSSMENTRAGVSGQYLHRSMELAEDASKLFGSHSSGFFKNFASNVNTYRQKFNSISASGGRAMHGRRAAFRQIKGKLGAYLKDLDNAKGLVQSALLGKNAATVSRSSVQVGQYKYIVKLNIRKVTLGDLRPRKTHFKGEIMSKIMVAFQQKALNTGYAPGIAATWNENVSIYTNGLDDVQLFLTTTDRSLQANTKAFAVGSLELDNIAIDGEDRHFAVPLLPFDPAEADDMKTILKLKKVPTIYITASVTENKKWREHINTLSAKTTLTSDRRESLRNN